MLCHDGSVRLKAMRAGCVLFAVLYFTKIFAKDVTDYPNRLKSNVEISEVETLLGKLLLEQWNEDEVPCLEATQAMLHGVRNHTLWATWMWDSMQRPTGALYGSRYQLGNFDQCMKPLWGAAHAQYCLADIHMTADTPRRPSGAVDSFDSTHAYLSRTSKHGRRLNTVTRGVCVPRACRPHSVAKVVRHMHRDTHLASPASRPLITVHSCQLAGEKHQYSPGFYAFLYLLAALCTIVTVATYSLEYLPPKSFASDIARCFDIKKNCGTLMVVSKDEINMANGIKFTNAAVTISAHYILFSNTVAIINGLDLEKGLEESFGFYTVQFDLIIDTFYAISGLLLANKLLSGTQKSVLKNLMKRYLRILAPLAFMVFYMACVHSHTGDGPLWPLFSGELEQNCVENWWLNFLLINNYVKDTRICHTVTWYISSDIQLALFGTLLCYIHRRNERVGKTTFLICFVVAILTPVFVTYWKELPVLFYDNIHEVIELTTSAAFVERYIKTQCRAAPYLAGMAFGYITVVYKPAEYRNSISKKWSIVGTLAAFFVMFKMLDMGGNLFTQEHGYLQGVAYTMVNRTSWAVAVCCIIGLCEYGSVPIVETYLNWGIFVPLSRLCYGMYLSHMALIYYCIHSIRTPIRHHYITMIVTGIGVGTISMLFGFLLWLLVEAPVRNLSNYLLGGKQREVVANGTAKTNGFHKRD